MRWRGGRESENVEDRRGAANRDVGNRMIRLPTGKGRIVLLLVVLVAGYYGYDLSPLLTTNAPANIPLPQAKLDPAQDEAAKFTSVMLAATETSWQRWFEKQHRRYIAPKLVMYRGSTSTGCGTGQAVMGPFYCPTDRTIYLDLTFYDEMKKRYGGGGEFAQAYVIAHEVGHHVQSLLNTEAKVRRQQGSALNRAAVNQLSVEMELQADCFAGVWGHGMQQQQWIEPGELKQALNAARAMGDDRLQKQTQGRVIPDSFTHGTSDQRYYWFKRGFDSGDPAQCNTFDHLHE